jgi:hypothetical protein
LNNNRLSLSADGLLARGIQVPGLLSPLSHGLNRLRYLLLLVDIGVAKFRCPGKILVHIGEHRRELR